MVEHLPLPYTRKEGTPGCVPGIAGPYIGGREFAGDQNSPLLQHVGSDVLVEFIIAREIPNSCKSDWRCFTLQFPMEDAVDQEERGFGVRYEQDNLQMSVARVRPARYHKIDVNLVSTDHGKSYLGANG
jgi:hypothetical protein